MDNNLNGNIRCYYCGGGLNDFLTSVAEMWWAMDGWRDRCWLKKSGPEEMIMCNADHIYGLSYSKLATLLLKYMYKRYSSLVAEQIFYLSTSRGAGQESISMSIEIVF